MQPRLENGIAETLGFAQQEAPKPNAALQLAIPMTLRRRGGEAKFVIQGTDKQTKEIDQTMIRAVAGARRWMADLLSGVHPNAMKLAEAYESDA